MELDNPRGSQRFGGMTDTSSVSEYGLHTLRCGCLVTGHDDTDGGCQQ